MLRTHDTAKPPIGQRRCPNCGLPMFLSEIETTEALPGDSRTFECQQCSYAETVVTVQFQ
jgi:ribosomal protein S27AE